MDFIKISEAIEERAISWREFLNTHPETAFNERETSKFVFDTLSEIGIKPERAGETGVCALITREKKGKGKNIGLRADMDALPLEGGGARHSCGHDVHTTVLLGAAHVLHNNRDAFSGSIKLIFQPAEEGLGGAVSMIEHGALENPKVESIVGLHVWPELPAGCIGIRRGPMMAASDRIAVTFFGKQGHAAHPEQCIDPITMAGHFTSNVQTIISRELSPLESAVLSFGKIYGGSASNIIPASVRLEGTIRTLTNETRKTVLDSLERFANTVASGMRGRAEVEIVKGTPSIICDAALCDVFESSAKSVLGEGNVHHLTIPSMGGEDFAYYMEKIPGLFFRLGCAHRDGKTKMYPLHSDDFTPDLGCLKIGIAVMSKLAIDLANG